MPIDDIRVETHRNEDGELVVTARMELPDEVLDIADDKFLAAVRADFRRRLDAMLHAEVRRQIEGTGKPGKGLL
jgi:hypothetical protein